MVRNVLTAIAALAGLAIIAPTEAMAQSNIRYRVFYQSQYNGEVRQSRNTYDSNATAEEVARELRTVHAVARAWVEAYDANKDDGGGRPKADPQFRVGQNVHVWWGDRWWDAEIREVNGNRYFIRYPGYDSSWDEWVGPSRIRAR